jgi:hypothetical protein
LTTPDGADWIPLVDELRMIERNGQWLCLNPVVPGWIVTTEAGALLLQLADGRRSVRTIGDLIRGSGVDVDQAHVAEFFADARAARLFDDDRETDPLDFWRERRLAALDVRAIRLSRGASPYLAAIVW